MSKPKLGPWGCVPQIARDLYAFLTERNALYLTLVGSNVSNHGIKMRKDVNFLDDDGKTVRGVRWTIGIDPLNMNAAKAALGTSIIDDMFVLEAEPDGETDEGEQIFKVNFIRTGIYQIAFEEKYVVSRSGGFTTAATKTGLLRKLAKNMRVRSTRSGRGEDRHIPV
ncbi:hypothetical protein [Aureimonas leprariae]|uniref:Uncharacterized protein n=1 Tax=Plantimonas leprariae TaxID=2615207 RepID=A0A7V7PJW4_9HYPH|nr:hypothetical protein [Aureimonas leprariae]KAB0675606.1 hypothetical protein F6X38_23025 [Aureimonas leprariae]